MDVLPADGASHVACLVGEARVVVLLQAVAPAFTGAALDAAELFDVDVQQLARTRRFVANRQLESEPS
jgi:hypothetical protein